MSHQCHSKEHGHIHLGEDCGDDQVSGTAPVVGVAQAQHERQGPAGLHLGQEVLGGEEAGNQASVGPIVATLLEADPLCWNSPAMGWVLMSVCALLCCIMEHYGESWLSSPLQSSSTCRRTKGLSYMP